MNRNYGQWYWTCASNRPRVAKLKLIFPAIRMLFSLQAFARSPRSKRRRVLYLKLPNSSMSSPDYLQFIRTVVTSRNYCSLRKWRTFFKISDGLTKSHCFLCLLWNIFGTFSRPTVRGNLGKPFWKPRFVMQLLILELSGGRCGFMVRR